MALFSASASFALLKKTTALASFSQAPPLSFPAELSSQPPRTSFLSLPCRCSPPILVARTWKLPATPDGSSVPEEEPTSVTDTKEESTAMPEPVEAQLAASTAGETGKGEDVFAVVMIGSRQYIVFPGRFIYTQRLKGANVDDKIILNKVLLVGTRTKTYIGQPVVTNATVHAAVEEQGLDHKVIVFKYKKKKNYRRNIGHRQPNTRIRITGIAGYQDFPFEALPETVPA